MRARGTAGGADLRDGLALLDGVAELHEQALVVRIARHVAVAVVDLDAPAVTETLPRVRHDPRGDRDHFGAGRSGEIEAAMESAAAGERIGAMTEVRRDPALHHRAAA